MTNIPVKPMPDDAVDMAAKRWLSSRSGSVHRLAPY